MRTCRREGVTEREGAVEQKKGWAKQRSGRKKWRGKELCREKNQILNLEIFYFEEKECRKIKMTFINNFMLTKINAKRY